ncbi:GNAT family N-acetyltransferase [Alphaproteobacteria bacterium]|nr:GNAT family N-acetyltransferase [Alphaproteobacteria bacterium]
MRAVVEVQDMAALAALHQACFSRPWNRQSFASLLAHDNRAALGVWGADGLDGFIALQHAADEAEILTLAVAAPARRSGLATQLLAAAANWLGQYGVQHWHLEVAADNRAALALYKTHGFAEIGRRAGYYENVDAVLMQRDL